MKAMSKLDRAPVFFTREDGTEMVTISRARFDELIAAEEDADDLAAAINARRSIDEEGSIPAAVSRAVRNGMNPIRAWRRHRRLTQDELAQKAGVTQGAIGKLEALPAGSGRRDTLEKVAAALGAPLDHIDPVDDSATGKLRRAVANSSNPKTGRLLRVG
jgi:DNA-binding XRE family transcriptional regulator